MDSPLIINIFYVVVIILFFIMIYWWWGIVASITALAIFLVIMFTIGILVINAKYMVDQKIHDMKEEAEKKINEIKDRVMTATHNAVEEVEDFIIHTKTKVKEAVKGRFFTDKSNQ